MIKPIELSRRDFLSAAGLACVGPMAIPRAGIVMRQNLERSDPWLEVDGSALEYNIAQVVRLARGRPILAVVKNNAYGLGLNTVAARLESNASIAGFAVVRTDEAITLRDAGVRKPILLMARAADDEVRELVERGVELAIWADDDAKRLASLAAPGMTVPVQFYIDSGMGRMGLPEYRALPLLQQAVDTRALNLRGMFTEFAEDAEFDHEQLRRFNALVATARNAGIQTGRLHAASSNGVFHLPAAHLDAVRPGIALYGAYPSRPEEERTKAELRPAVRLRARVVRVEQLRKGDSVSYGRHYIAEKPTWVATLPVGHSDGYPREAVKGARVLIGGRLYPVIGAVSASHCIAEIGDEPTVRIGDLVTFMGNDDPAVYPNQIAAVTGASVYDLLMHLSPLLPRHIT